MPKTANLSLIKAHFAKVRQSTFTPTQLNTLFVEKQDEWNIPKSWGQSKFQEVLEEKIGLKRVALKWGKAKEITRFFRGNPSHLEIAASLIHGSYLCHRTAAAIHGLVDDYGKILYINAEQDAKPTSNELHQQAIDRAFSSKSRISKREYRALAGKDETRYLVVSGKRSFGRGVEAFQHPEAGEIKITNMERTLIDCTIRPHYLGTAQELVKAFKSARNRFDVEKLSQTLAELNYLYPYNQSLGFLLQRAGYSPIEFAKLKNLKMQFNFYLDHGMEETNFDPEWRLFYPKELDL
jgi:predicted transcriptional regulator of viral defense system